MRKTRAQLALLLTLAFLIADSPYVAVCANDDSLAELLTELAPLPSNEALRGIPDPGRKLLALRSYMRSRSKLADRWSWTEEEIKNFQRSDEQQALLAEVAAVGAHFAQANPGYEIYVNTKVRSLEVQIRNWNSNESVGAAAEEIYAAWTDTFGADGQTAGKLDPAKLRDWLYHVTINNRVTLAAPGLTRHGRARAIDFQVMKDGEIIAGANSKQIEKVWRKDNWDVRLKESMLAAGPSFNGPLVSPNEPWHYDYDPRFQYN